MILNHLYATNSFLVFFFSQEAQTELVLLVFLRLAEDIVAFQNLAGPRRRDLYQALTSNMTELFTFFLNVLKIQTEHYNAKVSFLVFLRLKKND